jgi:serine/threonine protein kinase/beta-lactam-binding protein with PASTA domain
VQTAAPDTLVGRSLEGRYRILERIARGGMSTVYAAVDERLDRLVAVKVMSSALSADPAFSDRFAREARAAARLTHLNAVSVYDQGHEIGPDGHHVFLVMELVEGRTLRELLRERGRLAPAEAISIMEPVLSALSAAHRAGLVHRDVKPENILLSDDGIVKVADFGLARAVESDAAATRTGLMMGTVAYCAPEQISNGSSDPRSDVYSAGIVLFELLTGSPPYKGESAINVAYQHVHSRVPAPSSRVRGVPNEIDELVIDATDTDPAGRPADAGAFLAAIADIRTDLALPIVPVPPRARPRTRTSRSEPGHRTPDSATTEMIRGRTLTHDTTVVPRRIDPHIRTAAPLGLRDDNAPPPPVVTPPPKQRRQVSQQARRRRRAVIAVVLLLLVGAAAAYGGWWFASGRYSRVPELRGATQSAAVSELRDAGYGVSIQPGPQYDGAVPKGLVLRTDPDADTRLVRGKEVTVVISAGPHFYQLPNVVNKQFDDALRALTAVGPLDVAREPKQENSDTIPEGQVTRTDPRAGTSVKAGQLVTIYVSKGPATVDIPSVPQGTPFADARRTLKNSAGKFKVDSIDEYSDTVGKGGVLRIEPSDRAVKFSTITVTVSKGPEMVKVPDIAIGTPVADAETAVTDAGLVPDVKPFGGGTPSTVLAISPAGGQSVHAGSTVTIYALSS